MRSIGVSHRGGQRRNRITCSSRRRSDQWRACRSAWGSKLVLANAGTPLRHSRLARLGRPRLSLDRTKPIAIEFIILVRRAGPGGAFSVDKLSEQLKRGGRIEHKRIMTNNRF